MSVECKCDRCSNEVIPEVNSFGEIVFPEIKINLPGENIRRYNVCRECAAAIERGL